MYGRKFFSWTQHICKISISRLSSPFFATLDFLWIEKETLLQKQRGSEKIFPLDTRTKVSLFPSTNWNEIQPSFVNRNSPSIPLSTKAGKTEIAKKIDDLSLLYVYCRQAICENSPDKLICQVTQLRFSKWKAIQFLALYNHFLPCSHYETYVNSELV